MNAGNANLNAKYGSLVRMDARVSMHRQHKTGIQLQANTPSTSAAAPVVQVRICYFIMHGREAPRCQHCQRVSNRGLMHWQSNMRRVDGCELQH